MRRLKRGSSFMRAHNASSAGGAVSLASRNTDQLPPEAFLRVSLAQAGIFKAGSAR
jgi:hypothetical protein